MKKAVFFICLCLCLIPITVSANILCNDGTTSPSCMDCHRGCCSHHGGCASGSSSSSSSSYMLTPTYVYGCTDSSAYNYNPSATRDDGSCIEKKRGCMDINAINYDISANTEDNSKCQYKKKITKTKDIKYETEYKYSDKLLKDEREVKVKGVNGKKEIVYDAVVDKYDKVISKTKISEKITKEPIKEVVEVGTKESSPILGIIWVICLITVLVYANEHRNTGLIVNKIHQKEKNMKIILYVVYIIFILPVFVDIILVILDCLRKK